MGRDDCVMRIAIERSNAKSSRSVVHYLGLITSATRRRHSRWFAAAICKRLEDDFACRCTVLPRGGQTSSLTKLWGNQCCLDIFRGRCRDRERYNTQPHIKIDAGTSKPPKPTVFHGKHCPVLGRLSAEQGWSQGQSACQRSPLKNCSIDERVRRRIGLSNRRAGDNRASRRATQSQNGLGYAVVNHREISDTPGRILTPLCS